MRFDYFHALLVIKIMFGTSVNHFYFRNRNVTILKYLDIENHHFNLKLNINPYHLNQGENYLLSTCQQFIKSDPLFRLPSIFSHENDYPFVFHTRMRNFQKKMFSQHSAESCYFVQFGCVFVGWPVFWLSPSCRCIDAEESAKTLNEQLKTEVDFQIAPLLREGFK